MTKTVLLVEPRKHKMALASLMKFSTYFSNKGYRIVYTEGVQFFGLPKHVDVVVVSSVFTFDIPKVIECVNYYGAKYQLESKNVHVGGVAVSLMYDYVNEMCPNANIHIGLCDKIDQLPLDYSLYPDIDYSIVWTSRGCVRNCGFCAIPKMEGEIRHIENWEKQINMYKPRILAIDNNFTACSNEWFERVCKRLAYFKKTVDFNQSVDCRLFTEFHAKWFSKVRLECLRFSYDGKHVSEKKVRDAVELARSYGHNDIRFDVLYNWKDTPEEFWHRLDVLCELKVKAFPMKFVPLDSLHRNYVGKHWSEIRLKAYHELFGRLFSYGMIGEGPSVRDIFHKGMGSSGSEFLEKLDNVYINEVGKIDDKQFTLDSF